MQDSTIRQTPAEAASKKSITLNDVSYEVIERISVTSGEADLYIISDAAGEKFVLKYYRFNIKPKEEVMKILKNNPDGRAVKLIDHGQSANGRYYEIQQYAKHGDLSTYMKENPKNSMKFVWEFITEMNDCFKSIHALNIIHRDIKPANILIREMTPLKIALTDFGISSVSEISMRQTTFAGTFIYIPPESVLLTEQNEAGPGPGADTVTIKKNEEDIVTSKASDYWAMGLIILEMLTGRNPYQNIKNFSLLFGKVKSEPVPLEGVSDDFIDLLKGLLTKNPKKRWGAVEVSGWLSGKRDIPAYFETAEELSPERFSYKPYRFMDKDHFELRDIAVTMAANWHQALAAFAGSELKDWIGSQLNDRVTASLIDNLNKDKSLSDDVRLFDFICRVNPKPEFIYKGAAITDALLLDIAKRTAEKTSNDAERSLVTEILKYNVIARFYELSDPSGTRLETDRKAAAEACEFAAPEDMALAFLINHDGAFLKSLIKKIRALFVDSLVIKPAEGFKTAGEMSAKAVEIYEKGIFAARDIIKFTHLPPGCFLSRAQLDEMHAKAVEKVSELMEKHDIEIPFAEELVEKPVELNIEYYKKLSEMTAILENPAKIIHKQKEKAESELEKKIVFEKAAEAPQPEYYNQDKRAEIDTEAELIKNRRLCAIKRVSKVFWIAFILYLGAGLFPPGELLEKFKLLPDFTAFFNGIYQFFSAAFNTALTGKYYYAACLFILWLTRDLPESVTVIFQGDASGHYTSGMTHMRYERYEQAARCFEKGLKYSMSPLDRQRVKAVLSEALYKAREFDNCIKNSAEILALECKNEEGHFYLASSYLALGDRSDEAAKEYVYLFETKRSEDKKLLKLLFSYFSGKKDLSETAMNVYRKCHEVEPLNADYRKFLCSALVALRETSASALKVYADVLEDEPGRKDLKILLSTSYLKNKNYEKCFVLCDGMIKDGVLDEVVLGCYADAVLKLGKKQDLYDKFMLLKAKHPDNANLISFLEKNENTFLADRLTAPEAKASSGGSSERARAAVNICKKCAHMNPVGIAACEKCSSPI